MFISSMGSLVESPDKLVIIDNKRLMGSVIGLVLAVVGLYFLVNPGLFKSGSFPSWAVSALLFIVGGLALFFSADEEIDIDGAAKKIHVGKKYFGRTDVRDYDFSQVVQVALTETMRRNSEPMQRNSNFSASTYAPVYSLSLILSNGRMEPVPTANPSTIMINGIPLSESSDYGVKVALGQKISKFIGVPFMQPNSADGIVLKVL